MQRSREQQSLKPSGRFAWLGAVAIVLLQLQLAVHQNLDHHDIEGVGESCEVCLKLDSSGKIPPLSQHVLSLPRHSETIVVVARTPALAAGPHPHRARAPPHA